MKDSKRLEELAAKWLDGTITETEKMMFSKWYHQKMHEPLPILETFASSEEEIRDRMLAQIKASMKSTSPSSKNHKPYLQWAAAITTLLLVSLGLGYYLQLDRTDKINVSKSLSAIQAGRNKATLMLGNGQSVSLSDQQMGIVIGDEIKYTDGTAVLVARSLPPQLQLKTPKGGTYQITLSDGTKVWLNAASSLKYPLHFQGKERIVELTGEAYFEVAKYQPDKKRPVMPFKVRTRNQLVEVLGTTFNINAYEDESDIKTTLVTGAVRVSNDTHISTGGKPYAVLLKPGHQAVLTPTGMQVQAVQTEQFTAWKDGYFYFEEANIYTVMKQFARWYNIDVQYEQMRADDSFVGKIPRTVNLSTALEALRTAGVNFELIGNRRLLVKAEEKKQITNL